MLESLLPCGWCESQGRRPGGCWWTVCGGGFGPVSRGRELPCEYGPWQTVRGLLRRWQRQGVWARRLRLSQSRADAAGLIVREWP